MQNLISVICRLPMARNTLIVYEYVTNCITKWLEVKGVFLSSLFRKDAEGHAHKIWSGLRISYIIVENYIP